ncbi:MAG: hypothetical protein ABI821_12920 [Pseudomonadota bacterium]
MTNDNQVRAAHLFNGGMIRAGSNGGDVMIATTKAAFFSDTLAALPFASLALAQEPPKTPIEAPAEANAIALETGSLDKAKG